MGLSKEEQEKRADKIKQSNLAIEQLNDPNRLKERRKNSSLNDLELNESSEDEE